MELRIQRTLPCSPEIAYSLATEPERMCLWSIAPLRLLEAGDGGHPAGVGALREVTLLPRPALVLEEVVETSEPPERFVYRIVAGAGIRRHRGEMRFVPVGDVTEFSWDIELELATPALERLASRLFWPRIEDSLAALAVAARTARPARLPPRRRLDEKSALPALFGAVEVCRDALREVADELEAAHEPGHFFARASQYVVEAQVDACRAGRIGHPGWLLRFMPGFHDYYLENLRRSLHRKDGQPESHWQRAFRSMSEEDPRRKRAAATMAHVVGYGMRAHIEEDLPRALAETYLHHYRTAADYVRFRADFLCCGAAYVTAGERLLEHVPHDGASMVRRLLYGVRGGAARDPRMRGLAYDLARHRRDAFARGERLVELLARTAASEPRLSPS